MVKHFSKLLVVIFLSIIVIFLSTRLWILKSKIHAERNSRLEDHNALLNFSKMQVRYNGRILPINTSTIVVDIAANEIPLKNIIGNSPKLFFRFTERNCNSCIEQELKKIENLGSEIGFDNIVFLTTYSKQNSLRVLKKVYKIKSPIFGILDEKELPFDIEKLNRPYFFIADSSKDMYSFFIPDRYYPELSDVYYDNLKVLFNSHFSSQKHRSAKETPIRFLSKSHNLKDVDFGTQTIVQFDFVNDGNNQAYILNIQNSCGCMEIDWPKHSIAPKDTGQITVKFNANSVGVFAKDISIFANSVNSPIALKIHGNVLKK